MMIDMADSDTDVMLIREWTVGFFLKSGSCKTLPQSRGYEPNGMQFHDLPGKARQQ